MAEFLDGFFEMMESQAKMRKASKTAIVTGPERLEKELNALDDLLIGLHDDDSTSKPIHTNPAPRCSIDQSKLNKLLATATIAFPVADCNELHSVDNPLKRLTILMEELSEHGDYASVRDEYCSISVLLNVQSLIAPAFRPFPRLGKGDPAHMIVHQDQLVIDCHWLYCRNEPIEARDAEYMPIFDNEHSFPFGLAWKFANQRWTKAHRAEQALDLTPRQQCQLASLRSNNAKDLTNAALHGLGKAGGAASKRYSTARRKIKQWSEQNKRINRKDYEHLWLANELLRHDAPTFGQVAELFGLISGANKLNEKTVADKLKRLGERIGEV